MLGVLVLAALLAGCGGGGKSSPPLTKSEYIAQMKAIGQTLSESIGALSAAFANGDNKTAICQPIDGFPAIQDVSQR